MSARLLLLLQKHGLKSASKRRKALEAAEEEAEEMLELKVGADVMQCHVVFAAWRQGK